MRVQVPAVSGRRFAEIYTATVKRDIFNGLLGATRGHKGRAAKLLGVHPNTLTRLLAQVGGDPIMGGLIAASAVGA